MSGLEVAGFILAALPVVIKILASSGAQYRSRRFGFVLGSFLYLGRIVNTDALQQNHWDINSWTDPEVLNWKASHLASCNAIAVAGAIFASIGLTALQLPSMNAIHWSARACCSSSMVLGLTSVVTAARQHQTVGMLNSPMDIRLWLSRGRPKSYRSFLSIQGIFFRRMDYNEYTTLPARLRQFIRILDMFPFWWSPFYDTNIDTNTDINTDTDKYADVQGFQRLPLESSISALKATALPRHLLDLAVLVFLVGFGLYVLFLWLINVEGSGESYRNVFIIFIVTVGMYAIYDLLIELARILNDDKRNSEFNTNALGGFRKPEKLLALQKDLAEVQQRMKSEHPSEQELQEIQFQRQEDLENVVERESPTLATTNARLFPTGDRNFSSPLRAPAIAPATATLPAATRGYPSPSSSTNRSATPACKVDKYQAWQHYLISYMRTQAISKDHSFLLKIMEMKGSFEAEWDLAIAVTQQEAKPDKRESTKHQTSTHTQNHNSSINQASIHDETRTHDQGSTHDPNPAKAQRTALPRTRPSTPAAD